MAAADEKANDLEGPFTVLITGSNRGIGLEFVTQYLASEKPKYHVIAACRKSSDALNDFKKKYGDSLTIHENLDVSSEKDIENLGKTFEKTPIDICILNAGIMPDYDKDKFGQVNKTNLMRTFEVNAVGPILCAQALIPSLSLSKRKQYVVITSGLGTIQDNTSGGYLGYRMSKVGINSGMQDIKFVHKDFHSILIEPGFVPTELTPMNKQYATSKTDEVVKSMMKVIDDYKNIPNGGFWSYKGTPFGSEKDENGNEKYPRGKF